MDIVDLISPDTVFADIKATSKKQALQELSRRAAAATNCDEREILKVLIERERLGTTGVGQGIAIPHGKLKSLNSIQGFFARLDTGINYDAMDDMPVDLIFLLLAPEEGGADHLKALARVSRTLRNTERCARLRGTANADAIFAVLTDDNMAA
ncbi:transcriptional regulator [Alphaproteobacteria bacterium 46_93_T64]|nr:transcriptional regulator [Alphaproteobacteria bacterium 46_93_T64]